MVGVVAKEKPKSIARPPSAVGITLSRPMPPSVRVEGNVVVQKNPATFHSFVVDRNAIETAKKSFKSSPLYAVLMSRLPSTIGSSRCGRVPLVKPLRVMREFFADSWLTCCLQLAVARRRSLAVERPRSSSGVISS